MEKISQFVDHFLNPCTQNVASYIRDTSHFLTFLEEIHNLPKPTWLVTADVNSLYTMIPNRAGLHAAKEALDEFRPDPRVKPSNDSFLQLLELVLTKNNFKLNGEDYLQVGGTSLGTNAAPSYASTIIGKFDEDFVYNYPNQHLFGEDTLMIVFFLWTGTEDNLNNFIKYLNSYDPNNTFTFEKSQHSFHFLDTTGYLKDHELRTNL